MELPGLSSLAALEAVYRHGSVTRAARELHLSQSAVSHRLRALEQEIGVPLLSRAGRGIRVTPEGIRLAQAASDAFALLRTTMDALAPRKAADHALSLSCSPSFAIRFLVPRLSAFRAAHPALDLHVASHDVPLDPTHAGIDASVRLMATPIPLLQCEKLVDEVVFPVASPALLARGPKLTVPADLAHHTLLHAEALAHDPHRIDWSAWLEAAGERRVDARRGLRFSHAYLALEAALAGEGVALARRCLVADDLARGRLIRPFEPTILSGLTYWLVTPRAPAPALASALAALRGFLLTALRKAERQAESAGVERAGGKRSRGGARARRKNRR